MGSTHRERVLEALTDLTLAKPAEIMDWIKTHYPEEDIKESSYRTDLIGFSVNHPSSHFYSHAKFLWYDEESQMYRLATEEELEKANVKVDSVKKMRWVGDQMVIDGVHVVKVSISGQILIPQPIREKIGIEPGNYIALTINDKGFLEVRKAQLKLELR